MSVLDLQGLQAVREGRGDDKGGGAESQISLLLCIGDDGLSELSLALC
jgi:hypothetical protein